MQQLHGWVLGSIHGWGTKMLKAAWHSPSKKKLRNKTKQQLSEALLLFPRSSFLFGVCFFLHMYHPSLSPPPIFLLQPLLLSALFCSLHFALFPSVSEPHLSLCNQTRAKSFVYLEVGAEKRSQNLSTH